MADDIFQDVDGAVKRLQPQIQALKKDVGELAKSLIVLDKTTKSTAKSQGDLKQKSEQLTVVDKELIKLDEQLERAEAQLTEEYKQVQKAVLKKKDAVKKSNEELKKQAGIVKKSGGLFRSMTKSILAAGAGLIGVNAAIGVLKRVFGNAAKTIVGFEKGMSEVKAITNATDKEFQALVESAKELGSVTPKTASEVSGLQKEFAKLGFSTAEILAATEATISLSIAAGSDLAESATVAASTIRGFGLSATETQRVVDVMAKSFSSSALDLNKFKVAMAIVAPVAKAAGKDIEFATSQVGILADAGLDASTAGTSLRNMFLELNKQGLTWEQGLEKINTSTNKNVTALELFGKRGATAALILAENTEKAAGLEKELDGAAGTAQKMADTMADNLAGDIDKAKSAWEGMILSFEDGSGFLAGIGRGAIQSYTKSLSELTRMIKGVDAAVSEELEGGFEGFTDTLKEHVGVEGALEKALEVRANQLTKINDLEKALNIASGKRRRDIEDEIEQRDKIVESQTRVIDNLKLEVKANEDAEKAATDALAEQERVRTQLAEEEAQKRAEARERIQLKAAKRRAEFVNKEGAKEIDSFIAKLDAENTAFTESIKTDSDNITKIILDNDKMQLESAKKLLAFKKQAEADLKSQTISGINDLFGLRSSFRASEIEGLEQQRDAEVAAAESAGKDTSDIQAKFAKKESALRRKQAIQDKLQSLFNAGITIAEGIIKYASNPLTLPLVPVFAGLGAVQLGAIAATPIPKFRTGVDNFKGGLADVHSNEIIKLSDGSMFETPKGETRVYLPPASSVIPEHKAAPILQENKNVEQLKPVQPVIINHNTTFDENGMHKIVNIAHARNEYANIYMRQA
jgi:hypothetical protein